MTFVDGALLGLAIAVPTVADRAVAVDVTLFAVVAGIALLSVRLEAPVFLDAAVVATLLGFIATVSLARLIRRGRP
jgi:multicomponent Na+:H+ antiporter subunit F